MTNVQIRTIRNGPYEVKGSVQLLDPKGAAFTLSEDPIYLCRCGQSQSKPFCDGSHKTCGFQADHPAR